MHHSAGHMEKGLANPSKTLAHGQSHQISRMHPVEVKRGLSSALFFNLFLKGWNGYEE